MIRQLNTVIQVIENHFSPPFGKADVLKAPKHFPRPIVRYALRDMTLIWDIYGGHDFSSPEQSNNKLVNHLTHRYFVLYWRFTVGNNRRRL